jgi:outer membrane protein assembly factor BamB
MHYSAPYRIAILVSVGFVEACGQPDAKAPGASKSEDVENLVVASEPRPAMPLATKRSCIEPSLSPSLDRDRGIDAFVAEHPREAVDLLAAAVRADPRDRAAEAFRVASQAKLDEARARAADEVASLRRIPLETIPLARAQRSPVAAAQGKVHLEKQSEAKNLIVDFSDWETKNQLSRAGRRGHDALPAHVPLALGRERLRNAFVHADHVAAIYDGAIVISAEGKRPLAFDAGAVARGAPRPFEIAFAQLVGNTLLVELAYNGYAKESGGKNGYFAAFDATTGALAWVTDPLVANAYDAVVAGGSVITGYGFTAEPDFLFVLDLATGKVDQKIPLKSGPEAIRAKGDQIFVRSYDVDYVFKSTTGLSPALAASLPTAAPQEAAPSADAEVRCWVRRATAAMYAKDANGLHEAAERLKPLARDRVLDELLRVEEKKMSMDRRLDLSAAPLVTVSAPPWQASSPGVTPASTQPQKPTPKLVKVSSRPASPTRNMHPPFDPTQPWFIPPVDKGKLPEGARADIPSSFGQESLSAIIPDQRDATDRSILVYGGRFVALVKGDTTERVFDLDAFRHPPKADPQWKEFATQNVTYAQERDGVLYVCNGGGSYAKEVFGKKGFLSAIDATTGKLLWRSAALACNAPFAIAGAHIISGYGFTAEPDFVFLVRRADGGIVQKVPIESGPETITLAGSRVHVETYGHVVELDLR